MICKKNTLAIAAFAFVALAVGIFAFTGGADAVDMDVAVDAETGEMTLTYDGLMTADEVGAITADLSDASYAISMAGMNDELTVATLAYYEAVKPYIQGADFVISVAEVQELGAVKWAGLITALEELGVDTANAVTTISTLTPVAVAGVAAAVMDEALEAAEADKEQAVADAVAGLFTQEDVDAAVAEAVAAANADKDAEIAAAVAAALANVSDYKYTDADMDAAIDAAVEATYALYITPEQKKNIQDEIAKETKKLNREVILGDITQDEMDAKLDKLAYDLTVAAMSAKAVEEKDKIIADKDATINDLQKQIDDMGKPVKEKPIYEQGIGQCLIILVVFFALVLVWFLVKGGYLSKLRRSKE